MEKLRKPVLLLVVVLAALVLIFLWAYDGPEPFYRGRYLSQWLLWERFNRERGVERCKQEAIDGIGPEAVRWLLKWMTYEPSKLERGMDMVCAELFSCKSRTERKTDRAEAAAGAFR